jgi:glycosyltransferase involved in cell wall biosynthesis
MIADQHKDLLPIKYLKEPRQGVSAAKNKGIQNSQGELVIFIDDDVTLPQNWLSEYYDAYQKRPAGFFFGGSIVSDFEGEKPPAELLELSMGSIKGMDLGKEERALAKNEYFLGANWAVPAAALKQIGIFDENLGLNPASGKVKVGEESDLIDRLRAAGQIPYHLPSVTLKHFVPAAKCTYKHIGGRIEASAIDQARQYLKDSTPKIFNVPRWMIALLISNYLKWLASCLTGRKDYRAYITARRFKGYIHGLRKLKKDARKKVVKRVTGSSGFTD